MTVRLSIDGKMIDAPEGARLLDVARQNGMVIPTLCYHRDLTPSGNCRICVVEVQGQRFLQAACVTNVWEGMVVQTDSERVHRSRRLTLELMLANHPQDCLVCDLSGSCELQDLAYDYHVEVPEWGSKGKRYLMDSDPNPFIRVDLNKCILCRRCVLACAEVQGRFVWGVAYRGFEEQIVAGADTTMLEARCESCGQCSAYCPTGALSDKLSYGLGRAHQIKKTTTTCSYCGVGCQFDLNIKNVRLQRRAREDHAPGRRHRHGIKGIEHPAVPRSRGAQPAPAHHARTRWTARSRPAATLRATRSGTAPRFTPELHSTGNLPSALRIARAVEARQVDDAGPRTRS